MILIKKILILEDNFLVLAGLLKELSSLEGESEYDFEIMILTSSDQVDEYINIKHHIHFDIVLLDRDCKIHKSFHILDIEKIGADHVIGISSIKRYNDELIKRGVKRLIEKDLSDVNSFAARVAEEVRTILTPSRLTGFLDAAQRHKDM